jgi:hypothetical protein
VRHPASTTSNSVRVLDYGEDDGLCYIAMSLDGRTPSGSSKRCSPGARIVDPFVRRSLPFAVAHHDMGSRPIMIQACSPPFWSRVDRGGA